MACISDLYGYNRIQYPGHSIEELAIIANFLFAVIVLLTALALALAFRSISEPPRHINNKQRNPHLQRAFSRSLGLTEASFARGTMSIVEWEDNGGSITSALQ